MDGAMVVSKAVELVVCLVERDTVSSNIVECMIYAVVDVVAVDRLLCLLTDDAYHQREAKSGKVAAGLCDDLVAKRIILRHVENVDKLFRKLVAWEAASDIHDRHGVAVLPCDDYELASFLDRSFKVFVSPFKRTSAVEVQSF